jgi:hypothetical protein
MSPEQQRRALQLFDAWIDLLVDERERKVADLEAADPELALALHSLFEADAATGIALERPASGYAAAELLAT